MFNAEFDDPVAQAGLSIYRNLPALVEGIAVRVFGSMGNQTLDHGRGLPHTAWLVAPHAWVSNECAAIGADITDDGALSYVTGLLDDVVERRNTWLASLTPPSHQGTPVLSLAA